MNTVPKRGLILSAQGRARASKPPPGGNGTTSRIGRVGYACACAVRDTAEDAAAVATRCRNCLRWGSFIGSSLEWSEVLHLRMGGRRNLFDPREAPYVSPGKPARAIVGTSGAAM